MTIVFIGDSGSGKSTIETELSKNHGYHKIVPYTTRDPRDGEINGKDYHFISNENFLEMLELGLFATHAEYPGKRYYGTLKTDYVDGDNVVDLTPNDYRMLKKNIHNLSNIFTVYVETSLGNRVIRYIQRRGVDKFNFDDKNEICSRTDRDFGMFLGIKNEVDYVLDGNVTVEEMVISLLKEINERKFK